MKQHLITLAFFFFWYGCQKEEITIGLHADDTFYLKRADASMRVLVRGNTASKVFMVIVHGGPGSSSYMYQTPGMTDIVEKEMAVVYYDQRNAGASQGNTSAGDFRLDEYGNDLYAVLKLLQHRYGDDVKFFVLSKSFGGMVASSFMTKDNNQTMVKGWLFVDASHNYQLNDSLTHEMLLRVGSEHLANNHHAEKWKPIVEYCLKNPPGPFNSHQSLLLNQYGWEAQKFIEGLEQNDNNVLHDAIFCENMPITSYLLGRTNAADRRFNHSLNNIKFSHTLKKVTIPVLVCYGKLDFVCPQGLGDDFLAHIGSSDTHKIIFERSAHRFEEQEAYYRAFVQFVSDHL
jgi:pimeloyl-ACP methyl ester carboxylesterase